MCYFVLCFVLPCFLFMEFYLATGGRRNCCFSRVVKITIPEPELLRFRIGKKYEVIRLRKIRQSKYKQRRGRATLLIVEKQKKIGVVWRRQVIWELTRWKYQQATNANCIYDLFMIIVIIVYSQKLLCKADCGVSGKRCSLENTPFVLSALWLF